MSVLPFLCPLLYILPLIPLLQGSGPGNLIIWQLTKNEFLSDFYFSGGPKSLAVPLHSFFFPRKDSVIRKKQSRWLITLRKFLLSSNHDSCCSHLKPILQRWYNGVMLTIIQAQSLWLCFFPHHIHPIGRYIRYLLPPTSIHPPPSSYPQPATVTAC